MCGEEGRGDNDYQHLCAMCGEEGRGDNDYQHLLPIFHSRRVRSLVNHEPVNPMVNGSTRGFIIITHDNKSRLLFSYYSLLIDTCTKQSASAYASL